MSDHPWLKYRVQAKAEEQETEIDRHPRRCAGVTIMNLYRKKPVIVEAIQLPPKGIDMQPQDVDLLHVVLRDADWSSGKDETLEIITLEGVMTASPGDWIIRGVRGECYPCKPDIFEATYEPVAGEGK
jgi:hypothetical protein